MKRKKESDSQQRSCLGGGGYASQLQSVGDKKEQGVLWQLRRGFGQQRRERGKQESHMSRHYQGPPPPR